MISVSHSSGDYWTVNVQSDVKTEHRVKVTQADVERFAHNHPAKELLEESFRFLLERESNTSILASFDLPVIGRYFPEYEREMRSRLSVK